MSDAEPDTICGELVSVREYLTRYQVPPKPADRNGQRRALHRIRLVEREVGQKLLFGGGQKGATQMVSIEAMHHFAPWMVDTRKRLRRVADEALADFSQEQRVNTAQITRIRNEIKELSAKLNTLRDALVSVKAAVFLLTRNQQKPTE